MYFSLNFHNYVDRHLYNKHWNLLMISLIIFNDFTAEI